MLSSRRKFFSIIVGAILFVITMAAFVGSSGMTRIFSTQPTGIEILGTGDRIYAGVVFTPDGSHIVAFGSKRKSEDGIIDFWDVKTCKLNFSLNHTVMALAFSNDGRTMMTGGWKSKESPKANKIRFYQGPKWTLTKEIAVEPVTDVPRQFAVLSDDKHLISLNHPPGLRILNLDNLTQKKLFDSKKLIYSIAAFPDGNRVAVNYYGDLVEIWDIKKQMIVEKLVMKKSALSFAFSQDRKMMAIGSLDGGMTLWDASTLKKERELLGASYYPEAIAFTNDGKLLIGSMAIDDSLREAKVCIWSTRTGKLLDSIKVPKNAAKRLAVSPDNRWLVTMSFPSTMLLWDFEKIRRRLGE